MVGKQLHLIHADDFFPFHAAYLEDITYLVVNTQRQWNTHLNTYLWNFQLPEKRVLQLRHLCTYSDTIAYFVPSPSAILLGEEAQKLTTILSNLSNHELIFCYHQLREVRGLLTNVVNNGLVNLLKEGREGIWPYLFFSDGVVYIKRKSLQIQVSTEQIVETVRAQLREACAATIRTQAPGFKFSIQGIAKHPGYYFEFLTLEEYANLLARYTILRTTNDISTIPLGKLRQMQANGEIPAHIRTDFPADRRIGMLSRFFSVVFMTLLDKLDKKQAVLRKHVEEEVVKHLGLTPYWEDSKAIPNKGGVEYRWFWLGACYWQDHQGITDHDGEDNLLAIFRSTLDLVIKLAGDELRRQMPQRYLSHLTRYLDSVVELPLAMRMEGSLPDFQEEMERYVGSKSKGRKLICTLCNSAYPSEEQADNAVLFQPWVYKNKLSLYAGKNVGGICTICSLELMLRQILQKGQLRLTGSKFEALKTKYLAVYPNFFFTAETGAMVSGVIRQLRDINFFSIRRELEGKDITMQQLLELEVFEAPDDQVQPQSLPDDEEYVDEEGEDTPSALTGGADRSYIKFREDQYPGEHYPGLCFFGMRAGKDGDDTSTWAMPAFLALALPLVTNTKVVISEMSLPLFSSGRDFRKTVIFDAPHPYLDRLLKGKRVRVNQLLDKLSLLTNVYRVNLDTYADPPKPKWKYLSTIARDLDTDPLYVFTYLRKQQRREDKDYLPTYNLELYLHIYKDVAGLEDNMGTIQSCVKLYTAFYSAGKYQAPSHTILKPVDIVAKAIINSPLNVDREDLLWQIQGELKNWLDRVRDHQASGWAKFYKREDIDLKEEPAIRKFITYFYDEVFVKSCQEERGLLRSRINRFKDGCEAYYTYLRITQPVSEPEQDQTEQSVETEPASF